MSFFCCSQKEYEQDDNELQNKIDQYVILETIDQSPYYVAWKGISLETKELVTVKKVQELDIQALEFLQKCDSHNIIKVYKYFSSRRSQFIVHEFCQNKTLAQLLNAKGKLDEQLALFILKQIMCAMYQFHKQGLTIKEINAQHILIVNNKVKLGYNLGFHKQVSFIHNIEQKTDNLSMQTLAPEHLNKNFEQPIIEVDIKQEEIKENLQQQILEDNLKQIQQQQQNKNEQVFLSELDQVIENNFKDDIWCLAVLYFIMLTGKSPFQGYSKQTQFQCIEETTQLDFSSIQISDVSKQLLNLILVQGKKVENRIGWSQLLASKLFNKKEQISKFGDLQYPIYDIQENLGKFSEGMIHFYQKLAENKQNNDQIMEQLQQNINIVQQKPISYTVVGKYVDIQTIMAIAQEASLHQQKTLQLQQQYITYRNRLCHLALTIRTAEQIRQQVLIKFYIDAIFFLVKQMYLLLNCIYYELENKQNIFLANKNIFDKFVQSQEYKLFQQKIKSEQVMMQFILKDYLTALNKQISKEVEPFFDDKIQENFQQEYKKVLINYQKQLFLVKNQIQINLEQHIQQIIDCYQLENINDRFIINL